MQDATTDNVKQGARHFVAWSIAGLLVGAAVAAGAWWYVGSKVWTDGRNVRAPASRNDPREVLWTPPVALGEPFNTPDQEYEPSISPDGTELFFVRGKAARNADVYVSRRQNNRWTDPAPLEGVNSEHDDLGPRLTPDGRFLLFYSDRPGGQGGYDLWAATRNDDGGWGEPYNLGPLINSEFNEYNPAPTPDGKRLYFASNRKAANKEQKEAWRATIRQDAVGDYDLYVAIRDGAPEALLPLPPGKGRGEGAPERPAASQPVAASQPAMPPHPDPLPGGEGEKASDGSLPPGERLLAYRAASEVPGVNTPDHEGASCVSTIGDFLYFASNRPGGFGKFDLYRCRLDPDGNPGAVENLGPQVNTADNEADPQLAVGGFHLYFSSDRTGPDTRGGYDLLSAESREVYALRQGRPLPHLGWSWWVLLASVLLLIPLLKFLRGWNDRHLNILQKCLLVSLLLHVLLTLSLSFIAVTHQVIEFAKNELGAGGMGEVAVVGDGGSGLDIAMAIRGGGAGGPGIEVATEPPPAVEQRAASAPEAFAPAEVLDVGVPQARAVAAGEMVVQAVPRRATPANTSERVTVAPDGPELAAPQVALNLQPPVSEAERAAPVAPAAVDVVADKTAVPGAAAASPQAVQVALEPARLTGSSGFLSDTLAPVATASRPGTFKPQAFQPAPDLADVSGPATFEGPRGAAGPNAGQRVAAAAPEATLASADEPGTGAAGPAGLGRQAGVAGSPGAGAAGPAAVALSVPGASSSGGSLATAAPLAAAGRPGTAGGTPGGGASVPAVKIDATPGANASPQGVGPAAAVGGRRGGGPGAVTEPSPTLAATEERPTPGRAAVAASGAPGGGPAGQAGATGAARQPGSAGAPPVQPGGAPTAVAALPAGGAGRVGSPATGSGAGATPATPRVGTEAIAGPAALGAVASAASKAPVSAPEAAPGAGAGAGPGADQPGVASSRQDTGAMARAAGPALGEGAAGTAAGAGPAHAPAPGSSGSLAVAAPAGARTFVPGGAGATGGAGTGKAPDLLASAPLDVSLGKPSGGAKAGIPGDAGSGNSLPVVADDAIAASGRLAPGAVWARADLSTTSGLGTPIVPGRTPGPSESMLGRGAAIQPRAGDVAAAPLNLEVAITSPTVAVPEPMAQRSVEARKPLLEKLGGTKQSEDAVERALAYLARQQEEDGRWTYINGSGSRPGRRGRGSHDMALTGLATLAFLASDHTPAKAGPYREAVAAAVEFLITNQRPNGDLRGPRAGGGADAGNMYDQGIATLALAEAGLMTGDPRTVEAALKGADFIVKGQSRESGGWRYLPGEYGDTSVFGWQIMALHSSTQLGFNWPESSRRRAQHYVEIASHGEARGLAGYMPGHGPSQPMTAELLFSRILLGEEITDDVEQEASAFLTQRLPSSRQADFYCWYYGSLSLLQLQNDAWKKWNERTRETLVRMQRKGGDDDGCWDTNVNWGDRGGRVFTTALAALTLEVYYRYLPVSAERGAPATTPARPDIGYLAR